MVTYHLGQARAGPRPDLTSGAREVPSDPVGPADAAVGSGPWSGGCCSWILVVIVRRARRRWRSTTSSSASTPSCATSRSSGTCASSSRPIGPELRQYIVTDNDEERPFSRDQRRWVYTSAKAENTYFGFGTDNDLERIAQLPRSSSRSPFPRGRPARRADAPRSGPPAARAPRCSAAPRGRAKAFRPVVDRQHLGHELRLAQRQRHRGAQPGRAPWPARCRPPARAASRRAPPPRRRPRLADRHRLLRLPRRRRPLRPRPARRPVAAGAGPGHRDQAQPGRQARPRRRAPRRPRSPRRSPRSAASRSGVDCMSPAGHSRLPRRRRAARLRRAHRRGHRPARRHQVGGRRAAPSGTTSPSAWPPRGARRRLRHHRRRRGRHRRGAARVHRPRGAAVPVGLPPRLPDLRRAGPAPTDVVFIGSGKLGLPETRAARHGPRLRHGQRGPRGDALHRLHPGPALPHRPLPHRRGHPVAVAASAASTPTSSRCAAPTTSPRCASSCCASPRACGVAHPALVTADQLEILEDRWRAVTAREVVRLRARVGSSVARGLGGRRAPDDRHVNGPRTSVGSDGRPVRPPRSEGVERPAWSPVPPAGSW